MNPRIFFDFALDTTPIGRVIFELFADTAPKTAENFRSLCTGEKGVSPKSQLPLYYKNSIIHRSIADFMIQGGDFTKRNGLGGESIYGAPFEDEDLSREVDSEGLLVMANRGPNTNGSQFFITLRPCPHLNGKHVVFGRIIRGFEDVIQKIAVVPTDERDRPTRPVVIATCGELERRKAPVAKRAPSRSVSPVESEVDGPKKKRHRRSSASPDPDTGGGSDHNQKSKIKSKRHSKSKAKSKSKRNLGSSPPHTALPHQETEEEYDLRLEREENERLEAARKLELARLREKLAREKEDRDRQNKEAGTINYKGRGRMKYVDPETASRRRGE